MAVIVSQTTELLSLNRRNICDDNAVIDKLLSEIRKMIDDVVSTLELYTTSKNPEITRELSDEQKSLLGSICAAISTIGVNDESRLDGFLRGELDHKVEALLSTSTSVVEITDADESTNVDTLQIQKSPLISKAKIVGKCSSASLSFSDYTTEEESMEDSQPCDDHPRSVTTITEEPIDIETTQIPSDELKVSPMECDETKITMKSPTAFSTSAACGTKNPLSNKLSWATNKPKHQSRSLLEIQQEEI